MALIAYFAAFNIIYFLPSFVAEKLFVRLYNWQTSTKAASKLFMKMPAPL